MKHVVGCVFTSELADLIVAQLGVRTDVSVVLKADIAEAIQFAELLGELDVFIMEDDSSGKYFKQIPRKLSPTTMVVGIGDPAQDFAPKISFRSQDWSKVLELVNDKLGAEIASSSQYVSMPINLFSHFDTLNVDVFLQMTKDGKPHWVRRFLAGESIEASAIASYQSKNVKDFWVERDRVKDFSKKLIEQLGSRVRTSIARGVETIKQSEEVFASIFEITQKMGVKGQMVSICEGWMTELAKNCMAASSDELKGWWTKLSTDPALSFHYKLVRLTSLLCTQHVMLTDWTSKEEQVKKLNGVAMFADMALTNTLWIHLRTADSLKELTPDEMLNVSGHAAFSAAKLSGVPFVTKDIATLVAQHHGHPQGDRLPERVSPSVSPLALVYISCEEMAYHTLLRPERPVPEIYQELCEKYKMTAVKNPLEQMPAIFDWAK